MRLLGIELMFVSAIDQSFAMQDFCSCNKLLAFA